MNSRQMNSSNYSFEQNEYFESGIASKVKIINDQKALRDSNSGVSIHRPTRISSANDKPLSAGSIDFFNNRKSPYLLQGPIRPEKIYPQTSSPTGITLQSQIKTILEKRASKDGASSQRSGLSSSRILKEKLSMNPVLNDSSEVPDALTENTTMTLTTLEDMKKRKKPIGSQELFKSNGEIYGMQALELLSQEIDRAKAENDILEQNKFLVKSAALLKTPKANCYLDSIPQVYQGLQRRNGELEQAIVDSDTKAYEILSKQTSLLKQNQMLQSRKQRLEEKAYLAKNLPSQLANLKAQDNLRGTGASTPAELFSEITTKALMRVAYFCLPADDELVTRSQQLEGRLAHI